MTELRRSGPRNWFARGGAHYAQFRPQYPFGLLSFLAELSVSRQLAVDVGCGNGQLTTGLARFFDVVVELNPSASQLTHARRQAGVRYACARAEALPLTARQADLLVAAQAAHWFDLPCFYDEVRRVAAPGATLALVSYGVLRLPVDLAPCFRHFYHEQISPYWPDRRKLVEEDYRSLPFPFIETAAPALQIKHWWRADELVGNISTWSAVRRLREAGQGAVFSRFAQEITALWGVADRMRLVVWAACRNRLQVSWCCPIGALH